MAGFKPIQAQALDYTAALVILYCYLKKMALWHVTTNGQKSPRAEKGGPGVHAQGPKLFHL